MVTHFPYDFRARALFLVKDVRHHPSCASPSEPPTKDFLAWNGVPFGSQKTESRPGIQGQGNGISESSPWPGKQGQCLWPGKEAKSRFALHWVERGALRGARGWQCMGS
jgi:hypothetical protein